MANTKKVFTRTTDGRTEERVAHSAADEVALTFAGWTEKKSGGRTAAAKQGAEPATETKDSPKK